MKGLGLSELEGIVCVVDLNLFAPTVTGILLPKVGRSMVVFV